MEFLIKAEKGGTRRLFKHAEKHHGLPLPADGRVQTRNVAIEGPYGRMRPLKQFDSVILLAGSTGGSFTMPLLRDLVANWKAGGGIVTQRIRYVWVVKSRGQIEWFAPQLSAVMDDARALRAQHPNLLVEISVYCTCDDSFTQEHRTLLNQLKSLYPDQLISYPENFFEEGKKTVEDEKKALEEEKYSIREVESKMSDVASPTTGTAEKKGCGAPGGCCCTATIEDEDAIKADHVCECCAPSSSRAAATAAAIPNHSAGTDDAVASPTKPASTTPSNTTDSSSPSASKPPRLLLHPGIALFAGRPNCRTIIRKSLEVARGESAVVACGPVGLVDGVREHVVSLSDERAVHKGTGAQGIWFWGERFGW